MRSLGIILLLICVWGSLGVVTAQDGSSNVSDDVFEITCSTGESIIGGLKFTFVNVNPGFQYRVSAIGVNGFDPVIAVIVSPGYGSCNDDTSYIAGSEVSVSDIGYVSAMQTAAQVEINTGAGGNIDVIVGGYEGSSGQFALVVEGLSIDPASDADGFLVSVPAVVQELPMGIYMIAQRGSGIDPYLEGYYGPGLQQAQLNLDDIEQFDWCDDAGSGQCSAGDFTGGGIAIRNGYTYEADYYAAGMVITPNSPDRLLYVFGSSQARSRGSYGLVMTGNAPGYLSEVTSTPGADPAAASTGTASTSNTSNTTNTSAAATGDCTPVPAVIAEVSSEFDRVYNANTLLDNNPATGWSSSIEDEAPTLTLQLGREVTIGAILFNNYPASGVAYENDAVKDFYITAGGEDLPREVMLVQTTAELSNEVKRYEFEPVTASVIYVAFTSNYGGDYFEASDLIICAG